MSTKPQPSSMVAEFTRPEDLKQACYEACLDIVLYIEHLMGIAKRCQKNFPEVAEGLQGTAAGFAKHLRGVDGAWKTSANEELRAILESPDFKNHLWVYEFTRDPSGAVLILGTLAAVCSAKPQLTFWEALAEARAKLSDWEPLIQQLLSTSPLRRKQ